MKGWKGDRLLRHNTYIVIERFADFRGERGRGTSMYT